MANYTINILTLNTNVVTNPGCLEEIRRLLESERVDIALLQEVAVTSFNFYGYSEHVNVGPNRRGTAILWRTTIQIQDLTSLTSGRGAAGTLGDVRIVNLYAPAGGAQRQDRRKFFAEDITPLLAGPEGASARVVIGGDFNCVLEAADTTGAFNKCATLQQLVDNLALCDAGLTRTARHTFTYHSVVCRSRLDRIYLSKTAESSIKSVHVHTVSFGNHQGVSVHVNLGVPHLPQGPSYWKATRHTFHDARFEAQLAIKWAEWTYHRRRFHDTADWWDRYAKPRLQTFCRQFDKMCREEKTSTTKHYMQCLAEIYAKPTLGVQDMTEAATLRQAIKRGQRERFKDTQEHAKESRPCGGEEPSMHTVYVLSKKREATHIRQLEDTDGTVYSSQEDIIAYVRREYESKFTAPATPLPEESSILEDVQPGLNGEEREALTQAVTKEELDAALARAPRNKSPGLDGLPAEFYSAAWQIIGDTMLEVINAVLQRGRLCDSMYAGAMVLVPKQAKPTTLKHYRPITLLNADYKPLARCVAGRLAAVAAKVVHPMVVQAGASRNITASLCDLRDVVAFHDLLEQPGCLVSADIVGAYDNVRHDYMYAVMERMGFGRKFVQQIQAIYAAGRTRVQVNGFLSPRFSVSRSVRQGCPLSSVMFSIAISPLVQALHSRLRGIDARDAHLAVTAYADDVTVLLTDNKDAATLKTTLTEFGEVAGLAVSETKTVAVALGTWDEAQHPLPYRYVKDCRILGVTFARTVTEMINLTWDKVVAGASYVAHQNKHRALNLVQRVWFVSTYVLSKLWYVAQVLPIPDNIAAKLNISVAGFVWTGHLYRVPFPNLCAPRTEGGLGLLHPLWKARSLFIGRWMASVLTDTESFTSAMLQVLVEKWPPNDSAALQEIPNSLTHYRAYHRGRPTVPLELDAPVSSRDVHRGLYRQLTAAHPPAPLRALSLATRPTDWSIVWKHISRSWLGSATRSAWYVVVNDLVATNSRRHRHNITAAAACAECGQEDTLLHRMTVCGAAEDIRRWLNRNAARMSPDAALRPDRQWKPKQLNSALQWLLGKTVRFLVEAKGADRTLDDYLIFMAAARGALPTAVATKRFGEYLKRVRL